MKESPLPPEVIERSLIPPEDHVMHRYEDGTYGWKFNPVRFRRLHEWRKARQIAEGGTNSDSKGDKS
jgi:hypothetical protein